MLCTAAQLPFLVLTVNKLALCLLSFIGPYFLQRLIQYSSSSPDFRSGCLLVATFAICLLIQALLENYYDIHLTLFKLRLKSALSSILVENGSSMRLFEFQHFDLNESVVTNMMQVDVDRVCDLVNNLNELWNLPLLIVIACFLLYRSLKEAFLVGIALILLMIPFNIYTSSLVGSVTSKLMVHKDERISFLSQVVKGIVSVKMQGFEKDMTKLAMNHRSKELQQLTFRKYLDCIFVFTWAVMPYVVPLCTFIVAICRGVRLSVADTFLTLSLLRMLVYPLNCIPWVINSIVDSSVSLKRISTILMHSINDPSEDRVISPADNFSVRLEDAVFRYSAMPSAEDPSNAATDKLLSAEASVRSFEVGPITLRCKSGSVFGVVGAVGAGKTSLFLGLLVSLLIL